MMNRNYRACELRLAVAAPGIAAGVFATAVMTGIADVAAPVACFVTAEIFEGTLAAARHGASVAMMRIPAVIDVSIEPVRAAEPRSGAEKDATIEPIGAVIAVRSAVVGWIVKVAIGADGFRANVYPKRNLSGVSRLTGHQDDCKA